MVAGPHGGREAIPAVRVAGDAVEHDEGLGAGVGIPQRDRRWVKAVDGDAAIRLTSMPRGRRRNTGATHEREDP